MKYIELKNGGQVKVDDEDFEWLNEFSWRLNPWGYAETRKQKDLKRETLKMHRLINKTPKGFSTDHINHDKLDNRKSNLRTVTQKENSMNARPQKGHKFKGTHYNKVEKYWVSYITINGKKTYLGVYATEEEAALVYNKAAKEHFPDFAFLNDVPDIPVKRLDRKTGKTGYRGVSFLVKTGRYEARIQYQKKRINIGSFTDSVEAAMAYDKKAFEIYGEKARFNFPEKIESYRNINLIK